MGKFDLSETCTSTFIEGSLITGIPLNDFSFLVVNKRVIPYYENSGLYLENRNIAQFIAQNAYDGGIPVKRFSKNRFFTQAQYSQWRQWQTLDDIEIEGFNFPLKQDENFINTTQILDLGKLFGVNQKDIKEKLLGELEKMIYGSEPFRYCCRGKIVMYHKDDVIILGNRLFPKQDGEWYTSHQ